MAFVMHRLTASLLRQPRLSLLLGTGTRRDILKALRWKVRSPSARPGADSAKAGSSCTWQIRFLGSHCGVCHGAKLSTGMLSRGQDH